MRMQTKPNRWSCAVTAFAIALDMPVAKLIERIGHDGSQIIWPDLPDPMRRRGFHSQELVEEALTCGYACTPIEISPTIGNPMGEGHHVIFSLDEMWHRFEPYLQASNCVIECVGNRCRHAVHGSYGRISDPDGYQYDYTDLDKHGLKPYRIWIITS
jgi:hypothetical protein